MTPGARVAAAIEVLDLILEGAPAEQALTRWARSSRFAGSGDRAAVRDLVYESLRRLQSRTALAGAAAPGGRVLMIGALRETGADPAGVFTGIGHAPAPLTADEASRPPRDTSEAEALDLPDWLVAPLRASLGDRFHPVAQALRDRAPVILRVNAGRTDRTAAADALAAEGIATRPHSLASYALEVTENAARIRNSRAYADGRVELQDAAAQAACEGLAGPGVRVLDYCAGGGGKALALAAQGAQVSAHDIAPDRMRDLPARAARAGVDLWRIDTQAASAAAPWDLVLLDAPCSGSGTWRRTPDAKWRLTPGRLAELIATQARILEEARVLAGQTGDIVYMTCSLLDAENGDQIRGFLARQAGWRLAQERRFTPCEGGDGFYVARLTQGHGAA